MKALRILAKRLAFGLVTAWAVLTVVFLAFTTTRDWVADRIAGRISFGAGFDADQEEVNEDVERALAEHFAERGLDRPLHEQYVDWMTNVVTLDWGISFRTGEEVFPMMMSAVARTAMYVLPAIVLAVIFGLGIGIYGAMNPESRLGSGSRAMSYLLFAIPSFWVGGLLVGGLRSEAFTKNAVLFDHALPILFVSMTLVGGYVSYSRAYALEHAGADFVTLVRAKGAGPRRVARHVVRNAAIPLFSMLFTEILGLLVLSIFVIEIVFGIEGFGIVFFRAINARDIPVLLGATIVIIVIGVVGNIVQDLSYQYLDPRVEDQ